MRITFLVLACACTTHSQGTDDPFDTSDSTTQRDTEPTSSATSQPDAFQVQVELASDSDPSAPTTVGIVDWSFSGSGTIDEAFIRFGIDTTYGMSAPVDLTAPGNPTLLLGMKPASTYHFEVVATVDGRQILSGDYTVETGAPFTDATFNVTREEGSEPGFLVLTAWGGGMGGRNTPNDGITFIVDPDGDIVWWHDSGVDNANVGRISHDGKSMWFTGATGNGSSGLQRVSMDTLEREAYTIPATHDLAPLAGDCMALLYDDNPQQVYEMCNGDAGPTLVANIVDQGGTGIHYNAIRFNEDQGILAVSDHRQDVYGIDYQTGKLLWTLGDTAGSQSPHHGIQLLEDSLLVFANSGGMGGSAVIEFDLSDGSEIMRHNAGVNVRNLGDVQRLPGGNTLIVLSAQTSTDTVRELDSEGNIVMTMSGIRAGYGSWHETLYGSNP